MSHLSCKPVRKCHACLLNLGSHCWLYASPRDQWRRDRHCPGFENEEAYETYRTWKKMPEVKTRKDLRREFFRTHRKTQVRRTAPEPRK